MKKVVLFLFVFACGVCWGGGESNNGGNSVAGILEMLSQRVVAATFEHARNDGSATEAERKALTELLSQPLPFVAVLPETLPLGRFFDRNNIEGKILKIGNEGRLLDNGSNPVDARVVFDREQGRYVIQWDERSFQRVTHDGQVFPDSLICDIAHEVVRYGFHKGLLPRNDDDRKITGNLYVPFISKIPLKSALYRFDFVRRRAEIAASTEEILGILRTDLANHSMSQSVVAVYEANLTTIGNYKNTVEDRSPDEIAEELDNVEKDGVDQRERLDKARGLVPYTHAGALRLDFPARAKIIKDKIQRLLNLGKYNLKLRRNPSAHQELAAYEQAGGYFLHYRRTDWPASDELTAQQFDGWEANTIALTNRMLQRLREP